MFLAGHQIWDRPDLVPRLFAASRHLHFCKIMVLYKDIKKLFVKRGAVIGKTE